MKKIFLLVQFIACALLGGCASITGGTKESVAVETTPAKGAKCFLENDKGKWIVEKTPGSVDVHRSYKDLKVECDKQGYVHGESNVKSTTKPLAFGNILFGGAIGAGIDVASGAAYDYPTSIKVPMEKLS